jgi:peptide/nickel transport system permease protein
MILPTSQVPDPDPTPASTRRAPSPTRRALARFVRRKSSMAAVTFILLLVIVALIPGALAPHGPNEVDLTATLAAPSSEHPLGTDNTGRDLLARLLHGTQASLLAALVATTLGVAIGFLIGVLSGYAGGKTDYVLMRLCDALISIPPLLMAIAVAGVLGASVVNAMIGLSVVFAPTFARLARSQVLEAKEETFVVAAVGLGFSHRRILARHVFPNIVSPLFIQAFLTFGYAILAEGSLSFLGLSVQPPDPSWGNMVYRAFEVIHTDGWQILVPGVLITLTVWSFNVIGDGLRDSFSVR